MDGRADATSSTPQDWSSRAFASWSEGGAEGAASTLGRLLRYLPLSLLATAAVTALPIFAASRIAPGQDGLAGALLSALIAVALSLGMAFALAGAWRRWSRARELLFGDLLLWGWTRRLWAEGHLLRARAQFEAIAQTGSGASIELLEHVTRELQARDPYTHGHGQRVAHHAVRIARELGLAPDEVARIRAAAAVHDVGKIYTPQAILNNPGELSYAELELIRGHAADGAGIVGPAGDPQITAMVRHHHERLNGGGYPDGLVGEQIPLGARIIAVADCFDAITSTRAYRKARSHRTALAILSAQAGSELDPDVVAAFHRTCSPRGTFAWTALATAIPQRTLAWMQGAGAGLGASSMPQMLPVLGAAGALALVQHGHTHTRRPGPIPLASHATAAAPAAEETAASRVPAALPQRRRDPAGASAPTITRSRKREPRAAIRPPSAHSPTTGAPGSGGGHIQGGGPAQNTGATGGEPKAPGAGGTGPNRPAAGSSQRSSTPTSSSAPAPAQETTQSNQAPPSSSPPVSTPSPSPPPIPEKVNVTTPSVGSVPSVEVAVGTGSSISIGIKIGG